MGLDISSEVYIHFESEAINFPLTEHPYYAIIAEMDRFIHSQNLTIDILI